MSHSHQISHLYHLPGHRQPLWHQRTPFFLPEVSTNPQVNQFLGPKSSRVPGQLHLSIPHVPQQQSPSQSNIPSQTQVHIAHSPHNVPPPLNPLVNPPPVIPPQKLFNPQPPVIPSPIPASTATYLPVPNIPQQNIVHSPQARLVPCSTAPNCSLNPNSDLNLCRFPHNTPPNVNQAKSIATVFNNVQPNLPPSTANPAISHPILQLNAQQNPNSNHAANCSIPVSSLVQLLTSPHLLSRRLYIQHTGILLRCHCAGVPHRIPRLQRKHLKMQAQLRHSLML